MSILIPSFLDLAPDERCQLDAEIEELFLLIAINGTSEEMMREPQVRVLAGRMPSHLRQRVDDKVLVCVACSAVAIGELTQWAYTLSILAQQGPVKLLDLAGHFPPDRWPSRKGMQRVWDEQKHLHLGFERSSPLSSDNYLDTAAAWERFALPATSTAPHA